MENNIMQLIPPTVKLSDWKVGDWKTFTFTQEEVQKTQDKDIELWRKVLNDRAYEHLLIYVNKKNSELKDGDSCDNIIRGCYLDEFIANLKLRL